MPNGAVKKYARRGRIDYLDYLRLFASVSVVFFHWFYNGIQNGKVTSLEPSALSPLAEQVNYGVFLFIAISGFGIIGPAMSRTPRQFAVGRLARLFPLYWIALMLTTAVSLLWGGERFHVSFPQFLANLTMIPNLFGQEPVDGAYWTFMLILSFQLFLFALMALGLAERIPQILVGLAVVVLLVAIGGAIIGNHFDMLIYYGYFVAGAMLGIWHRKRRTSPTILVGIFVSAAAVTIGTTGNPAYPTLVIALVALALVPTVARARLPFARRFAEITYPVYLLHAHIGYIVLNLAGTPYNLPALYICMWIGLFAIAYAMSVLDRLWLVPTATRTLERLVPGPVSVAGKG